MYSLDVMQDSILRVGEVVEVHGRKVVVKVDTLKNNPDLMYEGGMVRNIAVGSYIEIRKGFLRLIGKVDGEEIKEDLQAYTTQSRDHATQIIRRLSVSLIGYIDSNNRFEGGTKELPLIGNEALVVSADTTKAIYKLVEDGELCITVAETEEGIDIPFPVDGLFNGHIAIFGNTGSGKSNTLAHLYDALVKTLEAKNLDKFKCRTRFLLLDFNGEYDELSITEDKEIYRLSTRHNNGRKLPAGVVDLFDLEILSVFANATDKTQRPFLKRALDLHGKISGMDLPENYVGGILRNQIKGIFGLSDKRRCDDLLDYLRQVLPVRKDCSGQEVDIVYDLEWVYKELRGYKLKATPNNRFLSGNNQFIEKSEAHERTKCYRLPDDVLERLIHILYIKLIDDVLTNRAQNEHIAPVINRLKSRQADIEKIIDRKNTSETVFDSETNFVVINLSDVNLEMRKAIPLMLCKKIYATHRQDDCKRTLNVIIDEAHQILSDESVREESSWKEYRLETFEEIIKEGRKFGVFVTISSQRPHDISPTITSQAHNYFIHRLINQHDLNSVSNAVSYIDKLSEESIPSLPTGTCVFSGVASKRPILLHIKELPDTAKPKSHTRTFS